MVDHKIFNIIGSIIIFSIWVSIAIIAIREFIRLMKTPGLSIGMSRKDMRNIKEPSALGAISRWKRIALTLFVCWIISVAIYMTVVIIIDNTIGFKD